MTPPLPPARRPYRTGDERLDAAVEALFKLLPEAHAAPAVYARQVVTTALKLVLDGASVGDVKLVNSALKELRWAFKVFGAYAGVRKVSVFGSARTLPHEPAWDQAERFGALMWRAR